MAIGPMSAEKSKLPKMEKKSEIYHPTKITNQEAKNCKIIGKMLAMIGDEMNTQASFQTSIASAFKTVGPLSNVVKSVNADALRWSNK